MIHYCSGGRTACRILSSFVDVTNLWDLVTCKSCKQTPEYTYFLELQEKRNG